MKTNYEVDLIRSGQPRPYADSVSEYLITVTVEQWRSKEMRPWIPHGNVDGMKDEVQREAARQEQQKWAKKIVRALCGDFREVNDDDGRTGMAAHFYPTLTTLQINAEKGTIRAVIRSAYTD